MHRTPVAQLVEHCEFNSDQTNTQGLKITEEKVMPLYYISKWLDFEVFSDKDYKP